MSLEVVVFLVLQVMVTLAVFGNYTVPDDPEGAEDFRAATSGIPTKQLAAWMKVPESQITRWRTSGNVHNGRLAKLAEHEPDAVRVYKELQARRARAIVVPREMVRSAADFLAATLTAMGWRPEPVKASLAERVDRDACVGCGRRVSSAA